LTMVSWTRSSAEEGLRVRLIANARSEGRCVDDLIARIVRRVVGTLRMAAHRAWPVSAQLRNQRLERIGQIVLKLLPVEALEVLVDLPLDRGRHRDDGGRTGFLRSLSCFTTSPRSNWAGAPRIAIRGGIFDRHSGTKRHIHAFGSLQIEKSEWP
jgi:hypothetical protein